MSDQPPTEPRPHGFQSSSPPPPPPPNPYGAAPAYDLPPAAEPVTRARSMDLAVLLMRVGAGLSLLSVLTVFVLGDQIRTAVEEGLQESGTSLDPGVVDAAISVATVFGVIVGLLGAGLWLLMAWANGRGRSWARIVATVLFGISAASFVFALTQPQAGLERVLDALTVLLGAVIMVLLWKRESSAYYAAMSARRQ
ncbi:hypothetical protein [uncultured Phycicoccus sp.]|uniref:hypothetical protein n=1 Tax=uncultured Phycicoccus sp. TaxID=661422 RepID=UPI002622D9BF|nr:hypothetical protein [uncultured Phycicoccus sp.]